MLRSSAQRHPLQAGLNASMISEFGSQRLWLQDFKPHNFAHITGIEIDIERTADWDCVAMPTTDDALIDQRRYGRMQVDVASVRFGVERHF